MSRFPARCFPPAAAARYAPEGVRQPRLFPRPRALLRCLRSPPPAEEERLCWAPGCTERDRRSFSEEAAKGEAAGKDRSSRRRAAVWLRSSSGGGQTPIASSGLFYALPAPVR